MHRTHEDASHDNPYICSRSISRSRHGTEDWSQTGDVQELDDKDLPCRHRVIVNTVRHLIGRGLSCRIRSKKPLYNLSVYEICCNQQQD